MAHQADQLEGALTQSLQRLRQDKVYALMIAVEDGLLSPHQGEKLFRRMESLKNQGMVEKIGVSVLDGSQLNAVFAAYHPDIVQVPLNVLDRRVLQSGRLTALKQKGVEPRCYTGVHTQPRSKYTAKGSLVQLKC